MGTSQDARLRAYRNARGRALRNARSTRLAHKLKSFQWNFLSYGTVTASGVATAAVLTTPSKVAQAVPAALATIFAGILSQRHELREACRRHHAAARDLKHEIVRFRVQEDSYPVEQFIDAVQVIDAGASLSRDEIR